MSAKAQTHGVLVTFRRRGALIDHLRRLSVQTRPLTTLTVVDNDADPQIEQLVRGDIGARAAGSVLYIPAPGNPGPAGGFRIGIESIVGAHVGDDDVVVLLDDDDPPRTNDVFADSMSMLQQLRRENCFVGGVGSWGATLRRRGRLRMATEPTPTRVDYLAGGACPHYLVGALRAVGAPNPDLFFGFEELDLGLALQRSGFELWTTGLGVEHQWGQVMTRRRASVLVEHPTWRRYYSTRNLITVLRSDGRWIDALFVSLAIGLAKPALNLLIRPRVAAANLRMTVPAVRDAWVNRLGRSVEPPKLAEHSVSIDLEVLELADFDIGGVDLVEPDEPSVPRKEASL